MSVTMQSFTCRVEIAGQTGREAMRNIAPGLAPGVPVHFLRPMHWLKSPLGRLRMAGWWEGISFLLLLGVAMPLKYLAGLPEAVRVVGMAHGILFILYVGVALQTALALRWSWSRTAWILLAGLLPAGPFFVEARVLRPADRAAFAPGQ